MDYLVQYSKEHSINEYLKLIEDSKKKVESISKFDGDLLKELLITYGPDNRRKVSREYETSEGARDLISASLSDR